MIRALFLTLSFLFVGQAQSKDIYITIGAEVTANIPKNLKNFNVKESEKDIAVVQIQEADVEVLSQYMHDTYLRCGGFVAHDSYEEALQVMQKHDKREFAKHYSLFSYTIDQKSLVKSALDKVDEFRVRSVIESLSAFHNRYYQSKTGVESQAWIKAHWEKLTQARADITVEYFNHSQWAQPSVVMTVMGSESPEEVVVIGGHADSIAGWLNRTHSRAPGADDNASGIAVITEAVRILVDESYQPKKTVKFMAYAAEEVGLRGSKEIAQAFRDKRVNVVGVLQLDMTNLKGSPVDDIVLISDYTNKEQNDFLAKLIDEYVGVSWGRSRCGYACSDHASWTNEGFPASMPFEAHMKDINRHIHTKHDTLEQSGGHAEHATHFAKLTVAYMMELAK